MFGEGPRVRVVDHPVKSLTSVWSLLGQKVRTNSGLLAGFKEA